MELPSFESLLERAPKLQPDAPFPPEIAGVQILPVDPDRDGRDIDQLLERLRWSLVYSNLKPILKLPRSIAYIAKKDGQALAFFNAHAFGPVGYLDNLVSASEAQPYGLGRLLYMTVLNQMKEMGIQSYVAHCTEDMTPALQYYGFKETRAFLLRRRDPSSYPDSGSGSGLIAPLSRMHLGRIAQLDHFIFGCERTPWLHALFENPAHRFYGVFEGGELVASLFVREKRFGRMRIDYVNAIHPSLLGRLLKGVLSLYHSSPMECYVREGSPLDAVLEREGFFKTDYEEPLRKLSEWRAGDAQSIGNSELVLTMNWS